MADEKTPAKPIKDGPGKATPAKDAVPPAPKPAAPKPASPAKTTGKGSDMPRKSAKQTIKDETAKASKQATDKARGYAKDGKAKATGTLNDVSKLMKDAASDVDSKFGEQYGRYARSAAGTVSDFADTIDRKDVDELVDELREFVRKSPAIAIGAAAALGFAFARVLKSGMDSAADAADSDHSA